MTTCSTGKRRGFKVYFCYCELYCYKSLENCTQRTNSKVFHTTQIPLIKAQALQLYTTNRLQSVRSQPISRLPAGLPPHKHRLPPALPFAQ